MSIVPLFIKVLAPVPVKVNVRAEPLPKLNVLLDEIVTTPLELTDVLNVTPEELFIVRFIQVVNPLPVTCADVPLYV